MRIGRRDTSADRGSRPTYSNLGTRIEQLLLLAEEQRDEIITEARQEAALIVDEARRQAEEILANAKAQAAQFASADLTQPDAGQRSVADPPARPSNLTQGAP